MLQGGVILECSTGMRHTPNAAAVTLAEYLSPCSRIIEIGSANGRDARYWASLGHQVTAVDFSLTALRQLKEIALDQGVMGNIRPLVWDISVGHLPVTVACQVDAFYARSALHVDDDSMMQIAGHIESVLTPNGIILIEGKGPGDKKIVRSEKYPNGLAIDHVEGGHVRRVWTSEFARMMCNRFNWQVVDLTDLHEEWQGVPANFMRLIARKVR